MTRISSSRGIMYSAPPAENRNDERPKEDAKADESSLADESEPSVSASASTDANWTGSVPADD